MITFQLNPAFYLRTLTFSVARYSLFSAIKKAVTCCFCIHLHRNGNIAHILSLSITPCTVMGVLFSSILYLPPPHYIFFPLLSLSPFSICPPHFLLSLSISSWLCASMFMYVGSTLYTDVWEYRCTAHACIGVCPHVYRCLCVSVIEWPRCRQPSSQSHIPVVYVVFPGDPLSPPFLLTLLIYHSSSVFTFYLFCLYLLPISPLPFHIFLCASFLSSYYSLFLSPSFLISPSCTFVSFRLSLCSVS